jgi:hypothetical protein
VALLAQETDCFFIRRRSPFSARSEPIQTDHAEHLISASERQKGGRSWVFPKIRALHPERDLA